VRSVRVSDATCAAIKAAGEENERVQRLLKEPDRATESPAEIKRGVWLR
jgi:hypothetical protein